MEGEKHVFTERGHFLWRCLSLIANDGRGRTLRRRRRQHTNIARGQLGSAQARLWLVRASKRKSWPSIQPLLYVPATLHCLHPPNFSPFLLSFLLSFFLSFLLSSPLSNFDLAVRPSVRPSVSDSTNPAKSWPFVCLLKDLTHSLTPDSRQPLSPCCNYIHFFSRFSDGRTDERAPSEQSVRGLGVTFSFIWVYKAAREGRSERGRGPKVPLWRLVLCE